ncbi:MAG: methylmalonyl-CoA mutase family protein [Candidatus Electryonea clarkiae]|nr:methylmalonyl-CoA mutase family protein [Candidatus Electryonea clarkiae]MDP8286406.1 methylmalonyl-CoA mutase family protein [Candidatus Electryonea clarkiae]
MKKQDNLKPKPNDRYASNRKRWEEETYKPKGRFRTDGVTFSTVSSAEVPHIVGPEYFEETGWDPAEKLGWPGEYPYVRGVQPTMYRGKLWTMRQFAGFGKPEETNERFKYLLENGQTGLSVAFDLPTLMGHDADDAVSLGEVGKCGVAISSREDMDTLFDGIPMDEITTSMTINGPAAIIWAFFIATAERKGINRSKLGGTLQNDILKEFIAQKEFIYHPEPSVKLVVDTIEFATKEMPLWNSVSISGYHIREAGSTAAQELAFTLMDGFTYTEETMKRGLDVDSFAPRLSHFFNAHIDFFEEIGKYRAAKRIYSRRMKERYGAKDKRSWLLRFHTQTAGCSLTAQQPENNIVRTAIEALAGVLGGTQSLHTNSMDETLALPSEKAATIALRTQQILGYETGVANTMDPLGGSYFIESMTDNLEKEAEAYIKQIEDMGGVVKGIENGFFQKEIARAAYKHQQELDSGERVIVGVNKFVNKNEKIDIPILQISQDVEDNQVAKLKDLRNRRDNTKVGETLEKLHRVCENDENVMPCLIECAHADVTLGEMVRAMEVVYGTYVETAHF